MFLQQQSSESCRALATHLHVFEAMGGPLVHCLICKGVRHPICIPERSVSFSSGIRLSQGCLSCCMAADTICSTALSAARAVDRVKHAAVLLQGIWSSIIGACTAMHKVHKVTR